MSLPNCTLPTGTKARAECRRFNGSAALTVIFVRHDKRKSPRSGRSEGFQIPCRERDSGLGLALFGGFLGHDLAGFGIGIVSFGEARDVLFEHRGHDVDAL